MYKPRLSIIFLIILSAYLCNASRILVVFPLPGKSHSLIGHALVRHLLRAGHEVSYITPYPMNDTTSKLHNVDISTHMELLRASGGTLTIKTLMNNEWQGLDQVAFLFMFQRLAETTMGHENVQTLLRDPKQHFDLVIAEWMFSEVYCGFAGVYSTPLIWLSPYEPHWLILSLIDEYTNPATNGYYVDDTPPFTFVQRIQELWFMIKMSLVRETVALYLQTSTYNKYFVPVIESRGRIASSFSELRYNASLVLGNTHVSMGQPMSLPQKYKAIGGYHIDVKSQPLPENLKKILDNSNNGVIYFSMGTNLASKDMPEELKTSLLKVFGSLKQTVLWKFEEKLENLPKNMHILEWAPQQSILAHPNCVLFITHGGLLSTTEAISAGKPIIGIPGFADQFINVARAVNKGFAVKVDLSYEMGPYLKTAIEEILDNPKYSQKAKQLSLIYHDRPVPPSDELLHWVRHVINTKGATHLRSPALLVPWYQKMYLDLFVVLFILFYILRKVIKSKSTVISRNKSGVDKKKQ